MADITELKQTDRLIDSVDILNANFNALNEAKAEQDNVIQLLDEKVDKSELGLEGGVIKKTIVVSGTDSSLAQSSANEFTAVRGGTDYSNGASLVVYGQNNVGSWAGCARLIAQDGVNTNILNLYPNGDLKLNGNEVERVVARGENYIRYGNGLQIVWGSVSSKTNQTSTPFTFPQSFKDANYAAAETAQTSVAARAHNMGSFTNNGATIYHESLSSSLVFRYIAIGLWK